MLICYPDHKQDPSKPNISVDFVDFGFINKRDNIFTRILSQRFNVSITDNPDLLFYSDTGGSHLHRLYTCKKIFWTGESTLPNFKDCDGALTPLYTNNPCHLRLPYYVIGTECDKEDLIKQNDEATRTIMEHRKGCSFVASNAGRKAKHRTNFFYKLSKYIDVYSGGKALNNIGNPIPPGGHAKFEFLRKYKFNLAFENKSLPGYATEKLIEAMWARTIPIYYGDTTISNDFNPKSFINLSSYRSEEECIEHILEIDSNESLYKEYLSESFFHNNQPNRWFDVKIYLDFIEEILDKPKRKNTSSFFGRWTIAKRMHLR